jgi:hypothetical protein
MVSRYKLPGPAKLRTFFYPIFVTICPETFSNLCVDSVRDM